MYCRSCGEMMNENQAICVKCGVKAGEGSNYCYNCGNQLAPGAEVWLSCGLAQNKPASDKLCNYDKITLALLCFFLGGIGVHNFMLGETKKGVFKIVMSFCFRKRAILALVDFIRILTDKYEVNPDKIF